MTFIYFICFLLITVGVIILLRLNPEKITDDLMRFVSPKQTLREKVLTAKGKKRSRKLTVELNRIRDALEQTGKGGQFSIACAASVVLMILGCILAIMIDNAFLIPVFAIAFAMIPFAYAKRTVNYYDNHIKEELETSLSIITTSYVRTDEGVSCSRRSPWAVCISSAFQEVWPKDSQAGASRSWHFALRHSCRLLCSLWG